VKMFAERLAEYGIDVNIIIYYVNYSNVIRLSLSLIHKETIFMDMDTNELYTIHVTVKH